MLLYKRLSCGINREGDTNCPEIKDKKSQNIDDWPFPKDQLSGRGIRIAYAHNSALNGGKGPQTIFGLDRTTTHHRHKRWVFCRIVAGSPFVGLEWSVKWTKEFARITGVLAVRTVSRLSGFLWWFALGNCNYSVFVRFHYYSFCFSLWNAIFCSQSTLRCAGRLTSHGEMDYADYILL